MNQSQEQSVLKTELLRIFGMKAVPQEEMPADSICLTIGDGRVIPLTKDQVSRVMEALMVDDETDLIPTGQVARMLGVTPVTVRRLLDSGAIPYVRYVDGGKRMVSRRDVIEFMGRRSVSDQR
ncbi:helix-turn-helix domain-containing protein [Bifidobacterium simiarum]|nr:helix-turn-helix domain-containing protein [Bifidobacterium simiarum]